jgi:cytochrome c oxidase assembly protein subunit 15
LLAVVFAVGFIYFLVRRYFDKEMIAPFLVLFLLGGLQGLIGWIMVRSGLNDTSLYVSHFKLAIHFIAALALLCYTLWFALKLLIPQERRLIDSSLCGFTITVIVLLTIQLIFGAFMSGLKAAPYAPTWPSMNGAWVPDTILSQSWVSNPFNVQFIHRILAYLLSTIVIIWSWWAGIRAKNPDGTLLKKTRLWPLMLVLLQVMFGIFTVLHAPTMGASKFGTYEILAESHQLIAMFFLVALVVNLYVIRPFAR